MALNFRLNSSKPLKLFPLRSKAVLCRLRLHRFLKLYRVFGEGTTARTLASAKSRYWAAPFPCTSVFGSGGSSGTDSGFPICKRARGCLFSS